jgi:serine kinase
LGILPWLEHPHVIKVHSILERQSRLFIFMQHCEAGDLVGFITRAKRVNEDIARIWFKQMISGLTYIHEKNIAHRDLKLENVLLTK